MFAFILWREKESFNEFTSKRSLMNYFFFKLLNLWYSIYPHFKFFLPNYILINIFIKSPSLYSLTYSNLPVSLLPSSSRHLLRVFLYLGSHSHRPQSDPPPSHEIPGTFRESLSISWPKTRPSQACESPWKWSYTPCSSSNTSLHFPSH